MRSLLYLNLILLLFFTSCDPVRRSTLSPRIEKTVRPPVWSSPFLKDFDKALFRTSLDVADKRLTGISIIKRTSDSSFHFTFANEIGMTYFDMEIYKHNYKADYIFDPLNKKNFLKVLQGDFSLMLFSFSESKPFQQYMQKESGEEVYLYFRQKQYVWIDVKQNTLTRLAGWSNYFDGVIVNFREYNNGFPSEIKIENARINLIMTLNLLGH